MNKGHMILKKSMTVIVVVTGLVGLSIINLPTLITNQVCPTVIEEAIKVGVFHRQLMGSMVLVFSIFTGICEMQKKQLQNDFYLHQGLVFY